MTKIKWTTDPPTRPGWYYYHNPMDGQVVEIVLVWEDSCDKGYFHCRFSGFLDSYPSDGDPVFWQYLGGRPHRSVDPIEMPELPGV